MKILVVYFSASGKTERYARDIAERLNADIFQIKPKKEYTLDDLNWMNNYSRTSLEAKDKSIRPEFEGNVENMDEYDKIFLGFPIWWYEAPNIVYSFLERYDFSNKTIIPFATSISSGYGKTNESLIKLIKGGRLESGVMVTKMNDKEFIEWIERNK